MTMAVCFRCGAIKFGALLPCPGCAAVPTSEDDLALSMAMTDHFFDAPTLERMGADVRGGRPVRLDPKTKEAMVGQLRRSGLMRRLRESAEDLAAARPRPAPPPPPAKKPWWKFW